MEMLLYVLLVLVFLSFIAGGCFLWKELAQGSVDNEKKAP